MGRIQSNVGLITGIPITDTIDQLIGVASQPRDILSARTQGLQQQQIAINTLSSRVLSLKFDLDRLKVSDPFQSRAVTSSQEDVLTATLNDSAQPPLGSFALRPAQTASAQQLISQRFETVDDIQGAGTISFGFGGFVDKGISLDQLNSGTGVARGEIKITDLAGNSSTIDLSLARSVDDALEAINNNTFINVTAAIDGDSFTLVDTVGGTGTLSVQEVNGGTTGADLGLTSITTTTQNDVVAGTDVYGLHSGTKLTKLNDGNGVRFLEGLDDLNITLRDGEEFGVDLSGSTTLEDVINAINDDEDNAGRLTAAIASDGNRLELTDSTGGSGALLVENTDDSNNIGSAADDLGIAGSIGSNTLTGNRLVSGLRGTLLSSLNGGAGVDAGDIGITDRSGTIDLITLSNAETLDDVIEAINASSASIVATLNEARNGIDLTDTSGGSGNLKIENVGGSTTATDLSIEIDEAVSEVKTGSLNRQTLSEATLLSSLNGGEGITPNDIRIFDSDGSGENGISVDLNTSGSEAKTIGDVIDAINDSSANVVARINDSGDGILITDTGTGESTLRIEDINGTLAADLNLTRASETLGNDQVIDGTSSFSINLSTVSTSNSGITLASLNDGAGINRGDIRITDSKGNITSIDLNGDDADILTVEQLIDAINERSQFVTASINSGGTGIQLTDSGNGEGTLIVEDISGTSAADLKIASNENTTTSINGFGLFSASTASQGALNNVATQINNLEAGVTASVFNDGEGFRLQLIVDKTGAANEILLDAGDSGFDFTQTSQARDALLVVGADSTPGSGVLVSSATNEFNEVINGVDLTAITPSDTSIDVTVSESDQEVVDLVQSFVDSYNSLRDDLGELTSFNEDDLSTGLLFGTTEALRVDTDLARLVTNRYTGLGTFSSLQDIGISVDETGKLSLDQTELKEAYAEDPQGLQNFFTATEDGVVARFNDTIERLTNADNGLLTNRDSSLRATIELNEERIERFNESLERQRARLELQFFQLEQVIANLQASQQAIGAIQAIPPLASTSNRNIGTN